LYMHLVCYIFLRLTCYVIPRLNKLHKAIQRLSSAYVVDVLHESSPFMWVTSFGPFNGGTTSAKQVSASRIWWADQFVTCGFVCSYSSFIASCSTSPFWSSKLKNHKGSVPMYMTAPCEFTDACIMKSFKQNVAPSVY
jgi:hypothetical protein